MTYTINCKMTINFIHTLGHAADRVKTFVYWPSISQPHGEETRCCNYKGVISLMYPLAEILQHLSVNQLCFSFGVANQLLSLVDEAVYLWVLIHKFKTRSLYTQALPHTVTIICHKNDHISNSTQK